MPFHEDSYFDAISGLFGTGGGLLVFPISRRLNGLGPLMRALVLIDSEVIVFVTAVAVVVVA